MSPELEKDIRLICKWLFYMLIATGIYFALKFINEREITVDSVGEGIVESGSKALDDGLIVGKDAIDKGSELTKKLLGTGLHITKKAVKQDAENKRKILHDIIKDGLTPPKQKP